MLQRILSILGWIGTALVLAAVAIRFVRPEWDQYAMWSAWAGLGLVVLYTLGQWREIVEYFRRRQARYGAIATVGVLVALAITVAVNYLGARQNKRWDLTASRQNSLAEQTVKVLQSLDAPVKFTVFDQQTNFDRFRSRLDAYAYTSPRVSVEYIDPDMKPVVAREAGIEAYGTVVVDYKGKRERVTTDTEQDLTNALIKAMSTMERKVYFLQGHGEREPNKTERDGYSAVSGSLRRDNYMVERLVLAQMKEVPSCRVNTLTDLFKMDQLKAIGSVVDWEHPKTGSFKTMNVIFKMSETPGSLRIPPPGLAAHTDEVLRALGKSDAEIARLKEVKACG